MKVYYHLGEHPARAQGPIRTYNTLERKRDTKRAALIGTVVVEKVRGDSPFLAVFGLSDSMLPSRVNRLNFTQLAFPTAAIYHFLKRRELLSADAALFWLGESLLGLGVYVVHKPSFSGSLSSCLSRDWSLIAGDLGWEPTRFFLGTLGYFLGCFLVALALTGAWLHYQSRQHGSEG